MKVFVSNRAEKELSSVDSRRSSRVVNALKALADADDQRSLLDLKKVDKVVIAGEDYDLWSMRIDQALRLLVRFAKDNDGSPMAVIVGVADRSS